MTRPRKDFELLFVQVPIVLRQMLDAESKAKGESMAKLVTAMLAKRYKVPMSSLPKYQKPGRKPKPRP